MKFTKSDAYTTGSNRKCLRCFKCKCKIFTSIETMESWCKEVESRCDLRWKRRIIKYGKVQLTWCELQPGKVRIFRNIDKPFIEGCEEKVADSGKSYVLKLNKEEKEDEEGSEGH